MNGYPSYRRAIRRANAADDGKTLAKSIGEVASPLLAGFSFTNVIVIVIVISDGTGNFQMAGEAIISWTIASIALIVAVQLAKYVAEGVVKYRKYKGLTRFSYHVGVVTFLLGFGFALIPHTSTGPYIFRWIASGIAFAASAGNAYADVRRTRRAWPRVWQRLVGRYRRSGRDGAGAPGGPPQGRTRRGERRTRRAAASP